MPQILDGRWLRLKRRCVSTRDYFVSKSDYFYGRRFKKCMKWMKLVLFALLVLCNETLFTVLVMERHLEMAWLGWK
jgi:hypothetical protein